MYEEVSGGQRTEEGSDAVVPVVDVAEVVAGRRCATTSTNCASKNHATS
jgi:hypothetical protein